MCWAGPAREQLLQYDESEVGVLVSFVHLPSKQASMSSDSCENEQAAARADVRATLHQQRLLRMHQQTGASVDTHKCTQQPRARQATYLVNDQMSHSSQHWIGTQATKHNPCKQRLNILSLQHELNSNSTSAVN